MRNPEGNKVELVFCPQIMKEFLLRDVCFDEGATVSKYWGWVYTKLEKT